MKPGGVRPSPVETVKRETPRLALSITEACQALGVSYDFWHERIQPEIRLVRCGRRVLVPVVELERWLDEHAQQTEAW